MALPDQDERRANLLALYRETRARTEALVAPLSPEDQQLQSMCETSPVKWHRAHTTWFFEAFILEPVGFSPVDPRYSFAFNSYYEEKGPRHARPKRGLLSRPSVAEITDYRRRVDDAIIRLYERADSAILEKSLPLLELGIAHEEQHQELILTDILHAFSESPLEPAYLARLLTPSSPPPQPPLRFLSIDEGLYAIGIPGDGVFSFDHERPRHKTWLKAFEIADRLLTFRELVAFVEAEGYRTPSLWLSEGWDFLRKNDITAPLYTTIENGEVRAFSLRGSRAASLDEPLSHVSYYEADAIARFLGARLPNEAEWEVAAATLPVQGNFLNEGVLHPTPCLATEGLRQMFGDVWEWTCSSYEAYPGYKKPPGAIGEYNAKFMVNQRVLRGGSCVTPLRHMRATYRNFWHPHTRFQMTGVRLAREGTL